jgi:hypothetical protein
MSSDCGISLVVQYLFLSADGIREQSVGVVIVVSRTREMNQGSTIANGTKERTILDDCLRKELIVYHPWCRFSQYVEHRKQVRGGLSLSADVSQTRLAL